MQCLHASLADWSRMVGQSPGARPITLHGNRPIARREADAGVSEHVYGYSALQINGCLEISNHTHEGALIWGILLGLTGFLKEVYT